MSTFFGLEGASDALDYMSHPLLSERLTETCELVRRHSDKTAQSIFGSIDAKKLRSSMTLFEHTPQLSICARAILDDFFDGIPCPDTKARLEPPEPVLAGS
jgi:uncharacterized protein (DUF1810 family)